MFDLVFSGVVFGVGFGFKGFGGSEGLGTVGGLLMPPFFIVDSLSFTLSLLLGI
ncbi:MAG: hypothetical protein WAK60_08000 [Sedimentisphaerales bacterium]